MPDAGLDRFILDKLERLDDRLEQVKVESSKLVTVLKLHEKKDEEIHSDVKDMAEKFTTQLDAQCRELRRYNEQLSEHMRRSALLEKSHKEMWSRVKPVVDKYEEEAVVEKVVSSKWKRRMKWIAALGTFAGSIYALIKLLSSF